MRLQPHTLGLERQASLCESEASSFRRIDEMIALEVRAPRVQTRIPSPPFHQWSFADGTLWTEFYRVEHGYLLRFPNLADFEVSANGLTVVCFPAPDVRDATPEHLYRNQVLPLLLSKLGKLVFHASAIETADGAIAFLGESGRGKSTLAAHFALNGHRVLTDDVLMLEPSAGGYLALPSQASIRLWADSGKMIAATKATTAPPLHFTSKTRFLTGPELPYCDRPRPLRLVYSLGDGSAKEIVFRSLSRTETFMEWTRNSFLLDIEDAGLVAALFDRVANVTNVTACYQLDYPRRYDALHQLRQAILEHAFSIGGAA